MDLRLIEAKSSLLGTGKDLPHLSGPAAAVRQVLAAHFVRDCPHVIEIGGHIRPVTPYLTHHPRSVLVVDPKTEPYEAEQLNGQPCRIRHVARKFQEIPYDLPPRSYGLVMLGYSLKPFGRRDPLGDLLFSLIDKAKVVVIEYPPALERASSQVPQLLARKGTEILCSFSLVLDDEEIAGSPYTERRFIVFRQSTD
jgi:hypothetical protein